jgi:hypothetical protein
MIYKNNSNITILFILLSLLFVLNSCSQIFYSSQVKKRIEIEYRYNTNKDFEVSKWQKTKRMIDYEIYDTNNNVIEIGFYGENFSSEKRTVHSDGSISVIHSDSWDYKKLGRIHYYEYNNIGQLIIDEYWNIKNNKKNYLIWKKLYSYDSTGFLVKEIVYNQFQKVENVKYYTQINKNLYISTDTDFVYSFDGVQKIESIGLDSVFLDDQNRPIIIIHYFKNKLSSKEKFEYSDSNNLVNRSRYDEHNSIEFTDIYLYNEKNQIITKIDKYIGSSFEEKKIYLYNKKNLLKKILYYENDKLVKYSKFKYRFFTKSKVSRQREIKS